MTLHSTDRRSEVLPRLGRLATSAALVLMPLTLASCGDDGGSASSESSASGTPTDAATSSTSPEDSASSSATPAAGDAKAELVDRIEAGIDGTQTAHVRFAVSGPTSITARGVTSSGGPDGAEARLTMTGAALGGQKLTVLIADHTIYMSLPKLTPPGKYFKVPAKGQLAGLTKLADGVSPDQSIRTLTRALTAVEDRGPATVGGTQTERYRLEADVKKALQGNGMSSLAQDPSLPKTLTYDLWLDADDHVRRLTYSLQGLRSTIDFTRWGEPVDVAPPAPADLVAPPTGLGASSATS